MQELAQATYNQTEFLEVMEMIDKRLNDKGKNWRHVFKALVVSDYLAHMGSDYVVDYMVDNIYIIKTLREFQHIDEGGRDRGADVRQRAKELYSLLLDRPRLAKERRDKSWANKYGGGGMGWGGGYNDRYASSSGRLPGGGSSRHNNDRPGDRHGRTSSYSHSGSRYNENRFGGRSSGNRHGVPKNYDEDAELKKAIEESAREAKKEEDKRKSQQQVNNTSTGVGVGAGAGTGAGTGSGTGAGGEVDLLGGFDDIATNNNNFASTGNLGMSGGNNSMAMMSNTSFNQQPQQQQMGSMPTYSAASGDMMGAFGKNNNSNFDPFGLNTNNSAANSQQQMMAMSTSMSGVGISNPYDTNNNSNNMFSSSSNQVFTQTTIATGSTPNPFGGAGGQTNMFDNNNNIAAGGGGMGGAAGSGGMGGVAGTGGMGGNNNDLLGTANGMSTNSAGAFDGATGAFGSAFDGGQSAKTLPFGVNPNDPNSRLAEIARNSDKIDPFASLAMGSASDSNPFGGTPSASQPTMMGGTTAGAGMTSSPFGSGTPNMSTAGGSSLVDLSPAALSGGGQQAFGQVNRNPFAQNTGDVQQGKQPSMNQLISGTTQVMSVSSFSQQPNMMGGVQATSPQPQQQQPGNPFAQQQPQPQQNNNIFGL